MSFYVRRDKTIGILLVLGVLIVGLYYWAKKERDHAKAIELAKAQNIEKQIQRSKERQARREKEEAERLRLKKLKEAKIAAAAEAQRLKEQAEIAAEEQAALELRLRAEEEQKRKEEAERLKKERLAAREAFKGTEYDELKIGDKLYKRVTVLNVDALGITIAHESGGRKINYEELPLEIQQACMYDPESTNNAKRKLKLKKARTRAREQERANNARKSSSSTTPKKSASEKKPVKPKGYVKCKVIRSYRDLHPFTLKKVAYKDIQVKVGANVEARLYVNDNMHSTIAAKERKTITIRSKPYGKYFVKLVTASGATLDTESHTRKSGL